MEIHAYIKQKKEFHKALIDHLDSDDDTNFKYDEILTKNLDNIKQSKDAEEIKSLYKYVIIITIIHFLTKKSHKFSFIFRQQCKKI